MQVMFDILFNYIMFENEYDINMNMNMFNFQIVLVFTCFLEFKYYDVLCVSLEIKDMIYFLFSIVFNFELVISFGINQRN